MKPVPSFLKVSRYAWKQANLLGGFADPRSGPQPTWTDTVGFAQVLLIAPRESQEDVLPLLSDLNYHGAPLATCISVIARAPGNWYSGISICGSGCLDPKGG